MYRISSRVLKLSEKTCVYINSHWLFVITVNACKATLQAYIWIMNDHEAFHGKSIDVVRMKQTNILHHVAKSLIMYAVPLSLPWLRVAHCFAPLFWPWKIRLLSIYVGRQPHPESRSLFFSRWSLDSGVSLSFIREEKCWGCNASFRFYGQKLNGKNDLINLR